MSTRILIFYFYFIPFSTTTKKGSQRNFSVKFINEIHGENDVSGTLAISQTKKNKIIKKIKLFNNLTVIVVVNSFSYNNNK